ncbi:hypothetical protein OG596_26565 [Streptomyces sp. NBC_01102]|uniref:hypothetical protein n=1 Tax=Streptomyces sp. NBC_01102 TaxID=2903749 RepID=UPI00386CDE15|nr:hypothetical protein OG596_26565 [Streptomyces sp. NBC_01102]
MNGPEHYREAERLLVDTRHEGPDGVAYIRPENIAAAQVHATLALAAAHAAPSSSDPWPSLETDPVVAYVYRAGWGMEPLGTYTNQDAARRHCEADATNHAENPEGITFDWLGDESEPDDPYELVVEKDGDEQPTDYAVTRIEVASEYDPEADA